jgi:hypothetical protein
MVVVFAPELRRAFSRLGEAQFMGSGDTAKLGGVVEDIANAAASTSGGSGSGRSSCSSGVSGSAG